MKTQNPQNNSSLVRPFIRHDSRALLFLALLLGVFGIARISNAQSATLIQDLKNAGDTSGSVTAATEAQLQAAITAETNSSNGTSYATLNSDLNYIFKTLPAGTGANSSLGDYQGIMNSIFAALNPSNGTTLATEYQNIAQETTTDSAIYTLTYKESAGGILAAEAISHGAVTQGVIAGIADGLYQNDSNASDDALIAQNISWNLHQVSGGADESAVPYAYEAMATEQTSLYNAAYVAESIAAYSPYADVAVTTDTNIDSIALQASYGGSANAAMVTGTFVSVLPNTDAAAFATIAAKLYPTVAPAVAYSAVSNLASTNVAADAPLIATDLAVLPNVNGALLSGSIASVQTASLTDAVRATVAEDVIAEDSAQTNQVAYDVGVWVSQPDKAPFAADLVTPTMISSQNYSGIAAISSTVTSTLAAAAPSVTSTEAAQIAQSVSYLLHSANPSQDGGIPQIYEAVANAPIGGAAPSLAEQAGIAASILNYAPYADVAVTTATGIEEESITAAPSNLTAIAVQYATDDSTYSPNFAGTAANGQTAMVSGSIGAAVEASVSPSGANPTLAGSVALAVANVATPGGQDFNTTLWTVAQQFGANTSITAANNLGAATALSSSATFIISNQNSTSGEIVSDDAITAITSAFGKKLTSLSDVENLLNTEINLFPENTADILGNLLATSTFAAANASALESYVDQVINAQNLLHDIFGTANLSLSLEDQAAVADITEAFDIATMSGVTNAWGGTYGGINGNALVGLTPDETPIVDM
jgi:hypothetical protein